MNNLILEKLQKNIEFDNKTKSSQVIGIFI